MMRTIIVLLTLFLFTKCTNNQFKVDISNINIDVPIYHFEKDLKNINFDSIEQNIAFLEEKYGDFFKIYNHQIIQIGDVQNANYIHSLKTFVETPIFKEVYDTCKKVFFANNDFNNIEQELIRSFKYLKYYFPQKTPPNIYTFMSGFNQSIIIGENILGIGLDKYLGENCIFYEYLNYPKYIRKRLSKNRIIYDCMYALGTTGFPFKGKKDDFISNCIYQGKLIYFVHSMIPESRDTFLLNYTTEQLNWSTLNEKNIWKYMMDKNQLFTTDKRTINNFIYEAPFTANLGKESAPRLGIFIGWKIVASYMKNNSKITLPELLNNNDFQNILANSNYNP